MRKLIQRLSDSEPERLERILFKFDKVTVLVYVLVGLFGCLLHFSFACSAVPRGGQVQALRLGTTNSRHSEVVSEAGLGFVAISCKSEVLQAYAHVHLILSPVNEWTKLIRLPDELFVTLIHLGSRTVVVLFSAASSLRRSLHLGQGSILIKVRILTVGYVVAKQIERSDLASCRH